MALDHALRKPCSCSLDFYQASLSQLFAVLGLARRRMETSTAMQTRALVRAAMAICENPECNEQQIAWQAQAL